MPENALFSTGSKESYWLTRFVILRLLGLVYAAAFFSAVKQMLPLIGSNGLLPLNLFLGQVQNALGSPLSGFFRLPSIFWLNSSDGMLLGVSWIGFALSCLVALGYANALVMTLLWVLYMSIVHAGQEWYGYGWEIQLLETGFLAIFICPLLDGRPFPKTAPPKSVIWLFRWLIFRVMMGSALIKLRGDEVWRNLTALNYHFETQPIPNPLSRWFHFLPRYLLKAGVLFTFLAEFIAPWCVISSRLFRHGAGMIMVAFQLSLVLSGNFSFFNWVTIIAALACFDDGFWAGWFPRVLVDRAAAASSQAKESGPQKSAALGLAALVAVLSIQPVLNLVSTSQVMNTSFIPLDLVNTYGAFGSVGRERLNVVFEGTDSDQPDSKAVWKEYPYQALPVFLNQRPRQIAPYQPRLDWQMWFAAMSVPNQYPWTLHLVWKLLHNDPGALSLLGPNPFPEKPPRYIRATLYRYHFAPAGKGSGNWWTREDLGAWLPPLSVSDPGLLKFLKAESWLD